MSSTLKMFLLSRELLDEEMTDMTYIARMMNDDLKLSIMFGDKMDKNKKFRNHVLNKLEADKNVLYLNKLKTEDEKYDAIIKIMNKYLSSSK